MSKRSKRVRRPNRGSQATRSHQHGAPPTPKDVFTTAYERFTHYIRSASNPQDAVAAARSDVRAAADQITRLACGLDVIRVVSSVRVAMTMERATTAEDPPAAVLELIALVLMCRDTAAPAEIAKTGAETGFMPPHLAAAARQALAAGSMITLFEATPSDAQSQLLFYSAQREITLRNPVYPHMLLDTLHGVFGEPAVNDDCRAVLGFTGEEAVNVMEALRTQSGTGLVERFARMEAARDATLPFLMSRRGNRKLHGQQPSEADRAVMLEMLDAVRELTTNVGEATVIDPGAIGERTGYPPTTVEAVLDAYTLTGPTDLDDTLDRFFRGDNPLRTAPIVTDAQGRRMLVHDALALPAVREVIETRLKAAGRQNAYEAHRGTWVEDAAVDLLANVFPDAQMFRGFNYFIPDPRATIPQTAPEKFTKRVEGDGLILVDDIAIIVEVKSVALTAEARSGVGRKLQGKLRDIVTNAASQAVRLRERIITDQRIRLNDDQWIDAGNVREIHTIAVGLEDLSGVTTATTALLAAGVLTPDHIPWTVSIHDLRIVCELLDRPSELLLYLRRRTEPAATWKYRAVDELDLFLLFLRQGLYVEPDPHETAQALPWSGPPAAEDIRRFQEQQPELVTSQTDQLDAWYDAQLGVAAKPAAKPKIIADRRLLDLADHIAATGSPGSLAVTASLLEGNDKVQRTFGRYATDLAKHVRHDRQHHSITHLMGETSGRHVLLVWACHGLHENVEIATSYLLPYVHAKKHQTGAYRAACLLFDPTGKRLLRLLYDNRPTGSDPALDQAAARLVPLHEMRKATPRPIRSPSARS